MKNKNSISNKTDEKVFDIFSSGFFNGTKTISFFTEEKTSYCFCDPTLVLQDKFRTRKFCNGGHKITNNKNEYDIIIGESKSDLSISHLDNLVYSSPSGKLALIDVRICDIDKIKAINAKIYTNNDSHSPIFFRSFNGLFGIAVGKYVDVIDTL